MGHLSKQYSGNLPLPGFDSAAATANFAEELAGALAPVRADFVSGRLGVSLDRRGQPAKMVYFDQAGQMLKTSAFNTRMILKCSQQYGIDLHDLTALGLQMDLAGVCYRPYEMFGSGQSSGVDFDDLIAASDFTPFAGAYGLAH